MARPGRIFIPLDVSYFDDAKVMELGPHGQLLDLQAMLLSKRCQSDGVVTRRQLERLASAVAPSDSESDSESESDRMIRQLVDSRLWIEGEENTFVRCNWDNWNDSSANVEAKSRAGQKANHVKHHVNKGKSNPTCAFCRQLQDGDPFV